MQLVIFYLCLILHLCIQSFDKVWYRRAFARCHVYTTTATSGSHRSLASGVGSTAAFRSGPPRVKCHFRSLLLPGFHLRPSPSPQSTLHSARCPCPAHLRPFSTIHAAVHSTRCPSSSSSTPAAPCYLPPHAAEGLSVFSHWGKGSRPDTARWDSASRRDRSHQDGGGAHERHHHRLPPC